jgi:hypothetical protein
MSLGDVERAAERDEQARRRNRSTRGYDQSMAAAQRVVEQGASGHERSTRGWAGDGG